MAGEARRTGTYPVAGSAAFDIYEGLWLGREKVALKTIRGVQVSQDTRKVRQHVHCDLRCYLKNNSRGSCGKLKSGDKCGRSIGDVTFYHFTVLALRTGPIRMFCWAL